MTYLKKNKVHFIVLIAVLISSIVSPSVLFASNNLFSSIPESASCRVQLVEDWFTNDIAEVSQYTSMFVKNDIQDEFLVRTEQVGADLKIIISPCVKVPGKIWGSDSSQLVMYDTWPEDAAGTWVLYRSKTTSRNYIRWYFQNNPEVYVQISPFENRSSAQLVIFNTIAIQNVTLGLSFESFYTFSFNDFYELTKKLIPWQDVIIPLDMYDGNMHMIGAIRELLPNIIYVEDAAYDENGEPVLISTGLSRDQIDKNIISVNSLGFLKWITDGLVKPLTGGNCYIEPLLTPTMDPAHGSLASVALESSNIYESLDWTRNLAVAVSSARNGNTSLRFANSGVDVTQLEMPGCPYIKNTGYVIKNLPALFYVLATREPDLFFFGAICEKVPMEKELHQYKNAAVFFPYFSNDGKFHLVIFEQNQEYTFTEFMQKYPDSYIELVRVKSSVKFSPWGM